MALYSLKSAPETVFRSCSRHKHAACRDINVQPAPYPFQPSIWPAHSALSVHFPHAPAVCAGNAASLRSSDSVVTMDAWIIRKYQNGTSQSSTQASHPCSVEGSEAELERWPRERTAGPVAGRTRRSGFPRACSRSCGLWDGAPTPWRRFPSPQPRDWRQRALKLRTEPMTGWWSCRRPRAACREPLEAMFQPAGQRHVE